MATDYDYELNPPRLAKQKNLDTCWACAMSGLLGANMSAHSPPATSEEELVTKYATTKTGGIVPAKLGTIAQDFGYLYNAFGNSVDARSIVTDRFIVDRLRYNGMMMAAWRVRDPDKPTELFFHAQIVWGVTYLTNQDVGTERAMLRTMNPWTAHYELWPLFWIYNNESMPLFTCWPKTRS
jgi:hypothetical protein